MEPVAWRWKLKDATEWRAAVVEPPTASQHKYFDTEPLVRLSDAEARIADITKWRDEWKDMAIELKGLVEEWQARADAAEALHHHGNFPVGASLDEFFEAAELDNVQADLLDVVVIVEQQGDLAVAFDARNRFDGNALEFFGVGGGGHGGHLTGRRRQGAPLARKQALW